MCCPSPIFNQINSFAHSLALKQRLGATWKRPISNSLRASSPGHSGGRAGKGRRACSYVSGMWIPPPCGSSRQLSYQISDQREAKKRANVRMSSPSISISNRRFRCRYSNSRGVVGSSSSFSCPAARGPRRAWSQAIFEVFKRTFLFKYNRSVFCAAAHKKVRE